MPIQRINRIEPDYAEAFDAYRADPNPETSGALLDKVHPSIEKAVQYHLGRVDPIMVGKARRMTLNALPRYDPQQASLATYINRQLEGLKREAAKQRRPLSVPQQLALDRYHYDHMNRALEEELGREPSMAELAAKTGFSRKRLAKVRSYNPALLENSLRSDVGELPGGLRSIGPKSTAWQELVYDEMDGPGQLIMEHGLGMHGKPILDNQAIARKLRMTPSAVSQRKRLIQQRLDEEQSLSPFSE